LGIFGGLSSITPFSHNQCLSVSIVEHESADFCFRERVSVYSAASSNLRHALNH